MPHEKFSLLVISVCLAGLMWLIPLAILAGPTLKDGVAAGGVFLILVSSGAFYALHKGDTGE